MLVGYPPFFSEEPSTTCKKIINWRKTFGIPKDAGLSQPAEDLIKKLINDSTNRLGVNGVQEIKAHPFFQGVDWKRLREKVPPYVPEVKSDLDVSNFDKFEEEEPWVTAENSKRNKNRQTNFPGYTFKKIESEKAPIKVYLDGFDQAFGRANSQNPRLQGQLQNRGGSTSNKNLQPTSNHINKPSESNASDAHEFDDQAFPINTPKYHQGVASKLNPGNLPRSPHFQPTTVQAVGAFSTVISGSGSQKNIKYSNNNTINQQDTSSSNSTNGQTSNSNFLASSMNSGSNANIKSHQLPMYQSQAARISLANSQQIQQSQTLQQSQFQQQQTSPRTQLPQQSTGLSQGLTQSSVNPREKLQQQQLQLGQNGLTNPNHFVYKVSASPSHQSQQPQGYQQSSTQQSKLIQNQNINNYQDQRPIQTPSVQKIFAPNPSSNNIGSGFRINTNVSPRAIPSINSNGSPNNIQTRQTINSESSSPTFNQNMMGKNVSPRNIPQNLQSNQGFSFFNNRGGSPNK